MIAVFCAFCLLISACGSDDPAANAESADGASGQAQADQADQSQSDGAQAEEALLPGSSDSDSGDTTVDASGDEPASTASEAATDESAGLDAETLGDRGLRLEGEENPESLLPDPTATPVPTTPPVPTPTPESETEAENVSVEPTPTPAPTPTSPPQNDPVQPQPPLIPQQPVPSDDLEIPGPPTDDGGEFEVISDNGILACATTEAAIEFLDRGDLTRTEEALQSASALASAASEPALAALAPQLTAAARNADASFDAIVAMLSACAQYGYEV